MRTLIAIPCMDMCHTDFLRALLSLEVTGEVQYTFGQSSLVYDARNALAKVALEGSFDRILWLDSDMSFGSGLFKRFSEHLDLGREFVTGLYVTRKTPVRPVIFKRCYITQPGKFPEAHAEYFEDYPRDDLFEVEGCGFGAVMMTVDLLRRVMNELGQPFTPVGGFGEDLSFCLRAKEAGAKLWCDSSIKLGHVGLTVYTEESLPVSESNT